MKFYSIHEYINSLRDNWYLFSKIFIKKYFRVPIGLWNIRYKKRYRNIAVKNDGNVFLLLTTCLKTKTSLEPCVIAELLKENPLSRFQNKTFEWFNVNIAFVAEVACLENNSSRIHLALSVFFESQKCTKNSPIDVQMIVIIKSGN